MHEKSTLDLTIPEIQRLKNNLEQQIVALLDGFSRHTGLSISDMSLSLVQTIGQYAPRYIVEVEVTL
jgi:hypothetical protein